VLFHVQKIRFDDLILQFYMSIIVKKLNRNKRYWMGIWYPCCLFKEYTKNWGI